MAISVAVGVVSKSNSVPRIPMVPDGVCLLDDFLGDADVVGH